MDIYRLKLKFICIYVFIYLLPYANCFRLLKGKNKFLYSNKYHVTENFREDKSNLNKSTEPFDEKALCRKLDKEIATVALPAFFSLAADPLASLVDAMYVGRLTAADQVNIHLIYFSIFFIVYGLLSGWNGYCYKCPI
jgi:hypothetical protein